MTSRVLLAAAACGLMLPAARAQDAASKDDDPIPIQRHLENVRLGDSLRRVKRVYPPVREWTPTREPGGVLLRYTLDRASAKRFPDQVEELRVALKDGRVAEIQAVYGDRRAKEKPLEKLVVRYEMIYGEPSRRGFVYTWRDRRTVLRAFNDETPSPDGKKVSVRPSLEIRDADSRRVD